MGPGQRSQRHRARPQGPALVNGKPANIWCAGQTFAANGELVVFGGNLEFPLGNPATTTWKGLDRVYTFDPASESWTEQPKMRHGRWYPTGIRMADGRIPILSGLDETGNINPSQTNPEVEVFSPSTTAGGGRARSPTSGTSAIPETPRSAASTRTCSRCPRGAR